LDSHHRRVQWRWPGISPHRPHRIQTSRHSYSTQHGGQERADGRWLCAAVGKTKERRNS
jgi:hypothetical protein